MSIAGAIDICNNIYVSALKATKGSTFKCVDCEKKVILRKGEIRIPHFAHYSQTNTCTYFEHPSESQQHKDAKMKLAEWLTNNLVSSIFWTCHKRNGNYVCGAGDGNMEDTITYQDGDEVITEFRDPYNKYVADIAVLNGGKVRYIFEIMHTHKTITTVRPEPWYEISSESIFEVYKKNITDISLMCVRDNKRYRCSTCSACDESWVKNLPTLTHKGGCETSWTQEKPCIICNRDQYNPIWNNGRFRQICKICIANNKDKLKEKYTISKPQFVKESIDTSKPLFS